MGIKSEGAIPNAWIYIDVKGMDIGTYVDAAMTAVNRAIANGTIHMPRPGSSALRNMSPSPRPNIVRGISSSSARTFPDRSWTARRPCIAIG